MKYNPETSGIRDSTVIPPGVTVPVAGMFGCVIPGLEGSEESDAEMREKATPAEWKGSWIRKKAS